MKNKAIVITAVIFSAAAFCHAAVLAPVDKYVTGSGSVWVVTESATVPKITLDGKEIKGSFTEDGKVRHLKISGIKAGASALDIDGVRLSLAFRSGAPAGGEPRFHLLGVKNCSKCHSFGQKDCKGCHAGYGAGKHKDSRFAEKCFSCHADGVPSTEAMAKVCSGCHDKHSLSKHPKLRHPITSENDPTRPGRKMDCASCHNPHQPSCPKTMNAAQKQEFCKECHTTP